MGLYCLELKVGLMGLSDPELSFMGLSGQAFRKKQF